MVKRVVLFSLPYQIMQRKVAYANLVGTYQDFIARYACITYTDRMQKEVEVETFSIEIYQVASEICQFCLFQEKKYQSC